MKIYDSIIIGAGVVGCMIASDMSRSKHSVLLLDKASDVATGASKANSGLIHAGFDAKEGTLKATLNVQGNKMYPSICARLGVPLKKVGALVVGDDPAAVKTLYERGIKNGVKDLKILSRKELLEKEGNLSEKITVGLYAEKAYIVSPYLLTISLCEEAIINGAEVFLESDITKITHENDIFAVFSNNGVFYGRTIINAAGSGVNEIAALIGSEIYPLSFRRGEYYVLDKSESFLTKTTIFPLPSKAGKGVLITPTIDGNILVGPTSYESDDKTITTVSGLEEIKQKCALILNNVNLKKSIRQFAGIRSISGEDFVIEKSKKVDGVLTIAGICSPGLSAAPAISLLAMEKLGFDFNPKGEKKITAYRLFKDLSPNEKAALLKADKRYGKIVCKCENITEGDIIFALKRPLKIHSVDAVKRRVRAGMGRCQGGFCSLTVAEIISKQNHIPLSLVLKENRESNVFYGDIRGGSL